MERTGIATAVEVEVDTLADRLRQEAVASNATWVSPAFIGAWARKTGAGSYENKTPDNPPQRQGEL
jgi:hypothetical protein